MQRVVLAEKLKNLLTEDLYDPDVEDVAKINMDNFICNIFADITVHIAILRNVGDRKSIKSYVIKHII